MAYLNNDLYVLIILLPHCSLRLSSQSNGWDANEMFRYNEVKYGVTSTYDSSLSMYT